MTVGILIVFLVFALTADWMVQRRKAARAALRAPGSVQALPRLVGLPPDQRAAVLRELMPASGAQDVRHHPGHAWARVVDGDQVVVGADELTGVLLGAVEHVELPVPGAEVRQGERAWRLSRGGRVVDQLSPVTGTVEELNTEVLKNPGLVNRFPYAKGWLLKVVPSELPDNMSNLFSGDLAREWLDLSRAHVNAVFAPNLPNVQATAQDGGELIQGLGDRMTEQQWSAVRREFFRSS